MAAYTNTVMLADTTDGDTFMGAGVDTNFTDTMQDLIGVYAEAYLCNLVKYDLVTNWASLNAIYKFIFSEYVGRSIGVAAMQYNMLGEAGTGFTRLESEDRINVHWARMIIIEEILKKADIQDFQGA